MKYLLYTFIASLLLLTSCSDASPIIPEVKEKNDKYEVRFTVKNDYVTTTTRAAAPLSAKIKFLEYWVLELDKADKPIVLHKMTTNAAEIDEQIQFSLPKGNYQMVVYATTNAETVSNFKNTNQLNTPEGYYCISAPGYDTDAFSQTIPFSVDGSSSVVHDLLLDRIVSRIELGIEDLQSLPAEVQSIIPVVVGYSYLSGTPMVAVPSKICLYAPPKTVTQGSVLWGVNAPVSDMPKSIRRSEFASVSKTSPLVIYYLPTSPLMDYYAVAGVTSFDFFIQGSKTENYVEMKGMRVDTYPDIVFLKKIKTKIKWEANKIYKYTGKIGSLNGGVDLELNDQWEETSTPVDKE